IYDGMQKFDEKFTKALYEFITESKYGSKYIEKVWILMQKFIDKFITVVSDWIACLFPDTFGLAGEVVYQFLWEIFSNGFTNTYKVISYIPDKLQHLLSNKYELTKFIKQVLQYLSQMLKTMNPEQY